MTRDYMINVLKNRGYNYNFEKYTDKQIYCMYIRITTKKEVKR